MIKCTLTLILAIFLSRCNNPAETDKKEIIEKIPTEIVDSTAAIKIEPNDLTDLLLMADRVEAYNFNDRNGNAADLDCEMIFDNDNQLICDGATGKRILSDLEIDALVSFVSEDDSYDCSSDDSKKLCYLPHLGFVFYQDDSCIAQINVCFICESMLIHPSVTCEILSQNGLNRITELTSKLGLQIITADSSLTY